MPKGKAIEGGGCWICGALEFPKDPNSALPWEREYSCMSHERYNISRLKTFPNNRKLKCFEKYEEEG